MEPYLGYEAAMEPLTEPLGFMCLHTGECACLREPVGRTPPVCSLAAIALCVKAVDMYLPRSSLPSRTDWI